MVEARERGVSPMVDILAPPVKTEEDVPGTAFWLDKDEAEVDWESVLALNTDSRPFRRFNNRSFRAIDGVRSIIDETICDTATPISWRDAPIDLAKVVAAAAVASEVAARAISGSAFRVVVSIKLNISVSNFLSVELEAKSFEEMTF